MTATRSASPTGPPVLAATSSHRVTAASTALTAIAVGTRRGSGADPSRVAAAIGQITSANPPTATAALCTVSGDDGSSRVAATASPHSPATISSPRAVGESVRRPAPVSM